MNWGDSRLPPRFWRHVVPEPNSGCWFWIGAATSNGYGVIGRGRRGEGNVLVHRWALDVVAPIEAGLHVDHLCRNTLCCNPHHLEAVTQAENNRRQRAHITTCSYGHPYDRLYTKIRRGRGCSTCNREYARRVAERRREGRAA